MAVKGESLFSDFYWFTTNKLSKEIEYCSKFINR